MHTAKISSRVHRDACRRKDHANLKKKKERKARIYGRGRVKSSVEACPEDFRATPLQPMVQSLALPLYFALQMASKKRQRVRGTGKPRVYLMSPGVRFPIVTLFHSAYLSHDSSYTSRSLDSHDYVWCCRECRVVRLESSLSGQSLFPQPVADFILFGVVGGQQPCHPTG